MIFGAPLSPTPLADTSTQAGAWHRWEAGRCCSQQKRKVVKWVKPIKMLELISSCSCRAAVSASGLLSPPSRPGPDPWASRLGPGAVSRLWISGLCVMLSSASGPNPGSVSCVLCHHLFQVEPSATTAPSGLWRVTPHQEAPEILRNLPEILLLSTKQSQGRHVGIMVCHSSRCLVP